MTESTALNRIPASTLRRWMLRAFLVGLGLGAAAASAALMN